MDSPIVAQLFRQLFRHRPCGCQNRLAYAAHAHSTTARHGSRLVRQHQHQQQQRRSYSDRRVSLDRGLKTNESRWQQRTHILPEDRSAEFAEYPYITLDELKTRTQRPRRVKMLLRDFIDGMHF
jgi:hypothetical protein